MREGGRGGDEEWGLIYFGSDLSKDRQTQCPGGPVHLGSCQRRWRESSRGTADLWPPPLPLPHWQFPLCVYASADCVTAADKSLLCGQSRKATNKKKLDLLSMSGWFWSDLPEGITALSFALEGKSKVCHSSLIAKFPSTRLQRVTSLQTEQMAR